MLQNLSTEMAGCYQKAMECRSRAEQSADLATRQQYLDMERRWLFLARSYEFKQRLGDFTHEADRHLSVCTAPRPATPRVMCPQCGKNMKLEGSEPCAQPRRADTATYTCDCHFTLQQTVDRID